MNTPLEMVHNALSFNHEKKLDQECTTRNITGNDSFCDPWGGKRRQKNESTMNEMVVDILGLYSRNEL